MDIFGFATQGVNYQKYRPTYPPSLIESTIKRLKHRNRYLDVATGTGQLLFVIAPQFQFSRGIDLSKQMIETARQTLKSMDKEEKKGKIELEVCNVTELKEKSSYDLITIGQALHFMPIESTLQNMKTLISKEGYFATFGYILKGVESNKADEDELFQTYYKKVKPLFTFDRDDLHTLYSDKDKYPFEKVFSKVQREVLEVRLPMGKQEYLNYLKTMSGYNLYLQKHNEDPLLPLSASCAQEVTCVLDYFRILCSNE